MSRNGFNDCEREYNRREEAIEMAKDRAEQAEARAAAAYDLLRECRAMLDGLEAQPLIYRIDAAIGEKK
jgi:hypothetical protein